MFNEANKNVKDRVYKCSYLVIGISGKKRKKEKETSFALLLKSKQPQHLAPYYKQPVLFGVEVSGKAQKSQLSSLDLHSLFDLSVPLRDPKCLLSRLLFCKQANQ